MAPVQGRARCVALVALIRNMLCYAGWRTDRMCFAVTVDLLITCVGAGAAVSAVQPALVAGGVQVQSSTSGSMPLRIMHTAMHLPGPAHSIQPHLQLVRLTANYNWTARAGSMDSASTASPRCCTITTASTPASPAAMQITFLRAATWTPSCTSCLPTTW